jgi:hypothetical protein
MTALKRTKLLYAGIGLIFGWMTGGSVNAFWFFYSVQSLGFWENDPTWYISALGILRPAIIIACMAAGYGISQWFFRRSQTKRSSSE